MQNNGNISLYNKLKTKFIVDIIVWTMFSSIVSLLLLNTPNKFLAISVVVFFFILYILKTLVLKKWIFSSFRQTLQRDLEQAQESIMDLMDTSVRQRELVATLSRLTENFKNFNYKLQNYAGTTKNSTTKIAEKTKKTINFAEENYINIKTGIEKMNILREQIQIIAGLILDLSEHVEQISTTVSVVENIAEQTNMLALNTAVEAARAGEHGKGFAVVAGEIRKLADESKQATHKITSMINNIQQVANSTVLATEEGANEIELTVKIVQTLDTNANSLKSFINDILLNLENVAFQMDSQSFSTSEADEFIKELEKNTFLSSEMLDKTVDSLNLLNQASDSFNQTILEDKK